MNQYVPYDFTIQFDDLGPIYIDAYQDISFCSSNIKYTAKYSLIISQPYQNHISHSRDLVTGA